MHKIDVIIPHINKPPLLQQCLKLYAETCNPELTRVIVIDNGSDEALVSNIYSNCIVVRNDDNLGMVKTLEQAKALSNAEILIYTHSDTFYYQKGWDQMIVDEFEKNPKLGLVGIVGGTSATGDGGRGGMYCSFRNGGLHGVPTPPGVHFVALLDGCSLMFRRAALDSFELDKRFLPHHFYDKDWCMEVLTRGWNVGVIGMDCEHLGGQITVGGQKYQPWADKFLIDNNHQTEKTGDQYFYSENERLYIEKWKDYFPVNVNADGSYTSAKSNR